MHFYLKSHLLYNRKYYIERLEYENTEEFSSSTEIYL